MADCTAQKRQVPFRLRTYMGESGFVAGTWLRNYLSSAWARRIAQDEYYRCHAPLVSQLIDRSTIWLAEWAGGEADGLLLGFIVGERDEHGPIVHYAYSKSEYREAGVGNALTRKLLETLRVQVPSRTVTRTWPRVFDMPSGEKRKVVGHALECGHELFWQHERKSFDCHRCLERPIRFTHPRAPGEWLAAQLGWEYTPYPALRHGWDRR